VATALTEAPAVPRLPISMTKDEDNFFTCIIGPPLVEDTAASKNVTVDYYASLLSKDVTDRLPEIRNQVQNNVEELTNTSFLDVLLTIFPERLIDNSIKMMV